MFGSEKKKPKFKFDLGDEAEDKITGFTGVIICRSQWLHNCNTYTLQPKTLKDGKPVERHCFDEPQIKIIKEQVVKTRRNTGGSCQPIPQTNR